MKRRAREKNELNDAKTTMLTCQRCENAYIVIWLNRGSSFNDFGDRHCPFCGLTTEEFYLPVTS
jgi:rubrerythrin